MQKGDLKTKWTRFLASKTGRRTAKVLQVVFVAGVAAYLFYALRDVRWADVWAALPTNPLFYLLFLLLYFLLPAAEILMYRITWTFDARKSIPVFIKKRIYNKDVLGYSGEVYFYSWARKNVGLADLDILKTIRDQNIVSSVASTIVAVVLLIVFLFLGEVRVMEWIGRQQTSYLIGGVVLTLLLFALIVRLRRYLFSMVFKTALLIFTVHIVRLVIGQILQIGMWAVAMPEVPLQVWFTYAALSIIITRIPLIPNRDLLFLGFGVSLSGVVGISQAGVFAMLAAITVLGRVVNLVFFTVLSMLEGKPENVLPGAEKSTDAEALSVGEPEEVS